MNSRNFIADDYFDDATTTVSVDMMRMGILVRFEADVSFYVMNFTNEVVISGIDQLWVTGIYDFGDSEKPRSIQIKVDPDSLTDDELAELKASAIADIEAEMRRDLY